jgi:uncharacterized membrane protein YvbJ
MELNKQSIIFIDEVGSLTIIPVGDNKEEYNILKEFKSMENIQCPKCGTYINEGEKFCKKCGEKTIYFKEESPKKEVLSKNKIIIIGVSVAAIVILAAMGIIISRNNSEKENKESTKIETTENKQENKNEEDQIETESFMTESPAIQQNNEPLINQENNIQNNVL